MIFVKPRLLNVRLTLGRGTRTTTMPGGSLVEKDEVRLEIQDQESACHVGIVKIPMDQFGPMLLGLARSTAQMEYFPDPNLGKNFLTHSVDVSGLSEKEKDNLIQSLSEEGWLHPSKADYGRTLTFRRWDGVQDPRIETYITCPRCDEEFLISQYSNPRWDFGSSGKMVCVPKHMYQPTPDAAKIDCPGTDSGRFIRWRKKPGQEEETKEEPCSTAPSARKRTGGRKA